MFAISSEFKKYAHLLLDLHFSTIEKNEDKADKIRDSMDICCSKLTELEENAMRLFLCDLYDQDSILKGWLNYEDGFDTTREQTPVINKEKQKEENRA